MAAFNSAMPPAVPHPAPYGAQAPAAFPPAPSGTFAPGTRIQVGNHKVVVQKYFSEGGFAHVYLVKLPHPIDGTDIAVLKRVAVPDKESLANMRTEVETMKKLKGHRAIVTYYDSHASQLKGGGYEVFLLMEFCNGGGLIYFMNTRLQNRLTEPEIMNIFSDVAEGVACMHYLSPPLLHRDLKVENVLITSTGSSKRFKLCDFGSTAPPRPAAKSAAECRIIEEDVQKNTTLQYRSPEMIDVYRKLPIDEKSDIWALGVLLYKLCYYTTPFEEQGQLAILNASFKFPGHPIFSDRLKKLIASMLRENPQSRPNIYQVLREACRMQGIETPIEDIYSGRTESEARRIDPIPSPAQTVISSPTIGAVFSPPVQQQPIIPEVVPMRRGRPMTASQSHIPRPSPSPMRGTTGDPFSALDSNSHSGAFDDAASRFPSLDQFSLLHDHGTKFDFDTALSATASKPKDLCMLVTEKLADEAFVTPPNKASAPLSQGIPSSSSISRAQMIISSTPALQEVVATSTVPIQQPEPNRPIMVSQGTMTSPTPPPPPPPPPEAQLDDYAPPIYRFPPLDHHRSSSLPRDHIMAPSRSPRFRSDERFLHKVTTHSTLQTHSVSQGKQVSSSRPSLEGGRPSSDSMKPIKRTQSGNVQSRTPTSFLESNMDYLRDREFANSKMGLLSKPASSHSKKSSLEIDVSGESDSEGESNIESHVEFLRTMEDQEAGRRRDRRITTSNKQAKRSSLPSMSLSGTKNLLAGKFGDAFKRFESNSGVPHPPRTPSPLLDLDPRELTPIAGSEATDGRSDDGQVPEETEDMSPEIRRELERRRLSLEDKRVVNAGVEFRKRLAGRDAPKSIGGITRAVSIQNKVKNLLDENQKPSPTKTAEGYGRYTDGVSSSQGRVSEDNSTNTFPKPVSVRKPLTSSSAGVPSNRRQHPSSVTEGTLAFGTVRSVPTKPPSSPSLSSTYPQKTGPRPSAPPKPTHLNGIPTGPSVSNSNANSFSSSPPKPQLAAGGPRPPPRLDVPPGENDDYVNFSKRFPSLSGIEMVVTDLGADKTGAGRTKET